MAPIHKNPIQQLIHPNHSLTLFDSNTKYVCDGCKILGIGVSFVNLMSTLYVLNCLKHFDMSYIRLSPRYERSKLGSGWGRILTRLLGGSGLRSGKLGLSPESVGGGVHPLRLLSSSESKTCVICKGACNASSWRYRCALCDFDIHMECMLVQCEKERTWLGISKYVPPSIFPKTQYFDGHAYEIPYSNHNHNNMPVQSDHGRTGRIIGKIIIFILVKAVTTAIFGM
ncbi:hypothetical protein KY290_035694 [Solanum tuberosum]|uniref:DC1 domain-containing protein n=1 Tax=Solanum tuberosum TaxID=4113 RepID=A0ABQ7TQV8_SOLTU|nr:hypothetical protein KY290_035694 [Solanum tuberosum]